MWWTFDISESSRPNGDLHDGNSGHRLLHWGVAGVKAKVKANVHGAKVKVKKTRFVFHSFWRSPVSGGQGAVAYNLQASSCWWSSGKRWRERSRSKHSNRLNNSLWTSQLWLHYVVSNKLGQWSSFSLSQSGPILPIKVQDKYCLVKVW